MEVAQVYMTKLQIMEAVVSSMLELVHPALDRPLEGMIETAAAAAAASDAVADTDVADDDADADIVHIISKHYSTAVSTIEMDHNETGKKYGAVP